MFYTVFYNFGFCHTLLLNVLHKRALKSRPLVGCAVDGLNRSDLVLALFLLLSCSNHYYMGELGVSGSS